MKRQKKIATMKKDRMILVRPVTESIRLYQTNWQTVKEAQRQLVDEMLEAGEDVQAFIESHRQVRSMRRTLVNAETRYPGILKMLLSGYTYQQIADRYEISRQRVHQLNQKLNELAKSSKKSKRGIYREIVSGK